MVKWLKAYFGFSKKELNGILVLVLLILAFSFFPVVYPMFHSPAEDGQNFNEFSDQIDKFYASEQHTASRVYSPSKKTWDKTSAPVYFQFDPNGLSEAQWRKLGLSVKQIRGIKNYESKGGRFFKKEDLKKMYTISSEKYAALEPYIVIKNRPIFIKTSTYKKNPTASSRAPIELNSADSTQLESLRGIGPAIALRIIRYRNRLGGFYDIAQLREVYGIDSAKFEEVKHQVTLDPGSITTIHINSAGFEDLKRLPYLNYKQINVILQYRRQHGSYTSINDLRQIKILNEGILSKIAPYFTY